MSKLSVAKYAINIITGIGVSKIVNDAIKMNTNVENTEDSIKVFVGSVVVGSMVADRASGHVNDKVDAVVEWWNSRKD